MTELEFKSLFKEKIVKKVLVAEINSDLLSKLPELTKQLIKALGGEVGKFLIYNPFCLFSLF